MELEQKMPHAHLGGSGFMRIVLSTTESTPAACCSWIGCTRGSAANQLAGATGAETVEGLLNVERSGDMVEFHVTSSAIGLTGLPSTPPGRPAGIAMTPDVDMNALEGDFRKVVSMVQNARPGLSDGQRGYGGLRVARDRPGEQHKGRLAQARHPQQDSERRVTMSKETSPALNET
jgi:hypothetical protein